MIDTKGIQVILGSSSKFRKRILSSVLPSFICLFPNIDERSIVSDPAMPRNSNNPTELVIKISQAKADAILSMLPVDQQECFIITCDQVVFHQGSIREKPTTKEQVYEYLSSYTTDYPAITVSAIVLTHYPSKLKVSGYDIAKQYFKSIPNLIIDQLLTKGDIFHCAGGFMIDDPILFPFLDRRIGDESSIIGLPLSLLEKLFDDLFTLISK